MFWEYAANLQRTPFPKCDFNKVALQLYWNRTSAWVFFFKFVPYFQNTFSSEHLWTAATVHDNYLTGFLSTPLCRRNDWFWKTTIPKYKFNTIVVTTIIIVIFISSWYCSYQNITLCIRKKWYVNIIRKNFRRMLLCHCKQVWKFFVFIDNWHGPKYVYDIHNIN